MPNEREAGGSKRKPPPSLGEAWAESFNDPPPFLVYPRLPCVRGGVEQRETEGL